MGYFYEVAVILFGVLYGGYCVGFSTPNLLHGWGKGNDSDEYRMGLWAECDEMSCRNIIEDKKLVSSIIGDWFYIVQGFSLCGFFLASVSAILVLLYMAVVATRGLGIIKAMIMILIISVIAQAAAMGLFISEAYKKWMAASSTSTWPHCTFGLSTYLISAYALFCTISIVLLILHHKEASRPDILEEALIND